MPGHEPQPEMPAVFISHGSPMVAVEKGPYQDVLREFGSQHRPDAIIIVSAHWDSSDTIAVSRSEQYRAIHDYGGFPRPLYELTYSPPGLPILAERVADRLNRDGFASELIDHDGLDHGVWIPLRLMYPAADVPVVQLSVPVDLSPEKLCKIGAALALFRSENVMVLGSGGIVHNLRMFRGGPIDAPVESWASQFDGWFQDKLAKHDILSLCRFEQLAPHANWAVPTFEHFAPVFIVLGAASNYSRIEPIFEGFEYGSISMRSFAIA